MKLLQSPYIIFLTLNIFITSRDGYYLFLLTPFPVLELVFPGGVYSLIPVF